MNTIENLPDGAAFLTRLRNEQRDFLVAENPLVIARAPGRLDVMGGIADYSGATVCEMPLAEAAFVALQGREDDEIHVRTTADVAVKEVTINARELPVDYEAARRKLAPNEATQWAAYVLGAFTVLACEGGLNIAAGANILLDSAVPLGKGVSSSAAIEVATLSALTAAASIELSSYELAVFAQIIENRVVGAPCGLMDQLTSVFGEQDHLLRIYCQPNGAIKALPIPDGVHFIGLDSGLQHAVTGARYGEVRVAAFMGYRIIADYLNLKFEISELRQVRIDDPIYRGFLCNIPLPVFRSKFLPLLPEQMSGAEFLARFGGITDPVTQVDPNKTYMIRAATTHPVEEEARVQQFMTLLAEPIGRAQLIALGELMYQAHASYSRCGLGSATTDALVEAVRQSGPDSGVFGAKITGGGSGGTVAVLAAGEAGIAAATEIAAQHAREFGIKPSLLRGSSPGARSVAPLILPGL